VRVRDVFLSAAKITIFILDCGVCSAFLIHLNGTAEEKKEWTCSGGVKCGGGGSTRTGSFALAFRPYPSILTPPLQVNSFFSSAVLFRCIENAEHTPQSNINIVIFVAERKTSQTRTYRHPINLPTCRQ